MPILDIILLFVLGGFVLSGLWFGFIHMVGSLVGLIFGTILASRWYEGVALTLAAWTGMNENLLRILSFLFLFMLIVRLVGLVVWLIDKTFSVVSFIPFVKTFNRLLGAAFGLIEGTFALGLAIHFMGKFPVSGAFEMMLTNSQLAKALNVIGGLLAPLLPAALRAIESIF